MVAEAATVPCGVVQLTVTWVLGTTPRRSSRMTIFAVTVVAPAPLLRAVSVIEATRRHFDVHGAVVVVGSSRTACWMSRPAHRLVAPRSGLHVAGDLSGIVDVLGLPGLVTGRQRQRAHASGLGPDEGHRHLVERAGIADHRARRGSGRTER